MFILFYAVDGLYEEKDPDDFRKTNVIAFKLEEPIGTSIQIVKQMGQKYELLIQKLKSFTDDDLDKETKDEYWFHLDSIGKQLGLSVDFDNIGGYFIETPKKIDGRFNWYFMNEELLFEDLKFMVNYLTKVVSMDINIELQEKYDEILAKYLGGDGTKPSLFESDFSKNCNICYPAKSGIYQKLVKGTTMFADGSKIEKPSVIC